MHRICMSLKNVKFGYINICDDDALHQPSTSYDHASRLIFHPIFQYDKWHQNWMRIFCLKCFFLVTGGRREILQGCKANGGYFHGHQRR
jgi:hypothetical protein